MGTSSVWPATRISPGTVARTPAIRLRVGTKLRWMMALPEGNEPFSRMRMMTSPSLRSTSSTSSRISGASSCRSRATSLSASASRRARKSTVCFVSSTVFCRITLMGVGCGFPGLYSWAMMLVPLGDSEALISRCTPNAAFIEPATCLYFCRSISEKESSSTKKQSTRVIRSAKVITHPGSPSLALGLACSMN